MEGVVTFYFHEKQIVGSIAVVRLILSAPRSEMMVVPPAEVSAVRHVRIGMDQRQCVGDPLFHPLYAKRNTERALDGSYAKNTKQYIAVQEAGDDSLIIDPVLC